MSKTILTHNTVDYIKHLYGNEALSIYYEGIGLLNSILEDYDLSEEWIDFLLPRLIPSHMTANNRHLRDLTIMIAQFVNFLKHNNLKTTKYTVYINLQRIIYENVQASIKPQNNLSHR